MIPDDCLALFAPAAQADLSGLGGVIVGFACPLVLIGLVLFGVACDCGREYWRGE